MVVLEVRCLEVANRPDLNRPIPRRYSIDHLSFSVEQGQRVLVVGGAGAGKNTLYEAIRKRTAGVEVTAGYEIIDPLRENPSQDGFHSKQILLINGFRTRDQFRCDAPRERVDPEAPQHWDTLKAATDAGATVVALAEVDKLESDKVDRFSRMIVIDDGRLVADSATDHFRRDLEEWIDRYARERFQSLQKDCSMLWRRLNLSLQHDAWLRGCP